MKYEGTMYRLAFSASESPTMVACQVTRHSGRERLRRNSNCPTRWERRDAFRRWFPKRRWCSSSTGATGDPSASASWRITAITTVKSGAPALTLAAVSVDSPETSETGRRDLRLPFMILCDTARRVVREWGIYNPGERGGIAKPAVFTIDPGRTVRYASVDGISSRMVPPEIVRLLQATAATQPARRKHYVPTPADFFRAIRNSIRFRTPDR